MSRTQRPVRARSTASKKDAPTASSTRCNRKIVDVQHLWPLYTHLRKTTRRFAIQSTTVTVEARGIARVSFRSQRRQLLRRP